jgi:hypothetical protein
MHTAFRFLHVNDLTAVPLYGLRFTVCRFFARILRLLVLFRSVYGAFSHINDYIPD